MPLRPAWKWVNQSLRFKITLLTTLLTAVLTVAFTSYYIIHERREAINKLKDKGELLVTILSHSIQIPLYAGNSEEVAMSASKLFALGDICNIRVYNSKKELIVYTVKKDTYSYAQGLTVTQSLFSSSSQLSPESLLLGHVPTEQLSGMIELEMDSSDLKVLTRKQLLISSILSLALWLIISSIMFLFLKSLTATFQLLMSEVKRIEEGDLSTRVLPVENDEPGRALAAINSLAETLLNRNEENLKLQAEVVQGLRLQIDEEKNKHMAKLIQTNRMTSLGLLVSSMAHEINNPNGAIRLAAEILERAWKDVLPVLDEIGTNEKDIKICGMPYTDAVEDIEKAVEAISRSSIRIERVVQNLRSYSIGDRDKQQITFDLNRVAENSVAIVRAHGSIANIVINTALSPVIPPITGNPFQLEQVVINLLLNAIQSMKKNNGKLITLSTKFDSTRNEVLLTVKDSGTGISKVNLPHVFEPFFSTRIDQGGSGLGLYIASFIVKEQNGTIELANDEDDGCRAVVRLPAAEPSLNSQPSP